MSQFKVVLVHHEPDRDSVRTTIENEGYDVSTARTATAALAKLANGQCDCIVSEYDLSGDDGLSLLEAVREVDSDVPFVLIADEDEDLSDQALAAGVDRVIEYSGTIPTEELAGEIADLAARLKTPPTPIDLSRHEPDPEEIVHAIDEAPVGISITDPSLPDNPVVYMNEALSELTGMEEERILGENARLFQGPQTDPDAIAELADAVASEMPTTVELKNYKDDGTPWWNELTIAPITDEEGQLRNFVGFQKDVTARKMAEDLAADRASKLKQERKALQRILTRVSDLLHDVSEVLVGEIDQYSIRQQVCDTIVNVDGYEAAWTGRLTSSGDTLTITAQTMVSDHTGDEIPLETLPDAVSEAINHERVSACTGSDRTEPRLSPSELGTNRCVVVPLVYGRKFYGVLAVYVDESTSLDNREEYLFETIGTMIATRLNAVETSKALTANRVTALTVSIEDSAFPLVAVANRLDGHIDYVGLTHENPHGGTEIYLQATCDTSVDKLRTLEFVEDVRVITDIGGGFTFSVVLNSGRLFSELADYGVSVVQLTAEPAQAELTLEVPIEENPRVIVELLTERYGDVELRSKTEYDRRQKTADELASTLDNLMTDRQQSALEAAYLNGYFEWPRPADGAEIADTMGITRQTFHQHLRAAQGKLVDAYFEVK